MLLSYENHNKNNISIIRRYLYIYDIHNNT